MRRVFFAVALALLVGPTLAHAQAPVESRHLVGFGLGGGVSVPVSDAKNAFKNGYNGTGFVQLNVRQLPVALRLNFTFQRFDLDKAKVGTGGTSTVLGGLANLQYSLGLGMLRPYIIAGLGAYNLKTEPDNAKSSSDTRFGVNGGAGLILRVAALSFYAEGRVDNVYTEKGLIDTKQIQVVPVTFGVVY